MNKTTPDKEKLREEWMELCNKKELSTAGTEIADWWLDKMEAQKAELIEMIDGKKRDITKYRHLVHDIPARKLDVVEEAKEVAQMNEDCGYNRALDDTLSILRKER